MPALDAPAPPPQPASPAVKSETSTAMNAGFEDPIFEVSEKSNGAPSGAPSIFHVGIGKRD
jgi:hypothetical protein